MRAAMPAERRPVEIKGNSSGCWKLPSLGIEAPTPADTTAHVIKHYRRECGDLKTELDDDIIS